MMLDLDFFKKVNDNYGHSVGDTTLKHFAKILQDYAAEHKSIAGRWGGEEFVIILSGQDGTSAQEMAEEVRKTVEEYLFPEIYHITCSIGVTELVSGDDFTEAFNRLDKALYASKHTGRNKVTLM